MMLEFRRAAACNSVAEMERLSQKMSDTFNIDEPGPASGKTAAHVAAERGNFQALYWLFERAADFYCKDNAEKTPVEYLQQKEFEAIRSKPMLREHRNYHLCNAHYKIWLAHDPEVFMPYLYQEDFRQYRERNPEGYLSLVYSKNLLGPKALSDLRVFAEKYQITLISFEEELSLLTARYGTDEDKQCYDLAFYELRHYPNQQGGNLAVVSDMIRWSTVLLRKGNYSDTDVQIGQHTWTGPINTEKSIALNMGSIILPGHIVPWLNGDIIATASLFPKPLSKGEFRATLSKTACFIIKKIQSSLVANCKIKMGSRLEAQRNFTIISTDLSLYLKDFFRQQSDRSLLEKFSPQEIYKIRRGGLERFSSDERASLFERMADIMKKRVEEEFGSLEIAKKHSNVFLNVEDHEHEKFLKNYNKAVLMNQIKDAVKEVTGVDVIFTPLFECIEKDGWEQYSIYSNPEVKSAFRSENSINFNTTAAEYNNMGLTKKTADLSFTTFGMESVMRRSQALQAKHLEARYQGAGSDSVGATL